MITFKQFISESALLTERFINIFPQDQDKREEYVDSVWDMLQKSYSKIGGIKGSGFGSKEDMVSKIPFWKVATHNGKPVAVVLYKDKGGRKVVASGTDGSKEGKLQMADMVKNEITRAFGEKSKAPLGMLMKVVPWDVLEDYTLKPEEIAKASGKTIIPVTDLKPNEIPEDGQATLNKFPQLKPYAYVREIGGNYVFKVAFGTTGKQLKF